MNQTATPDPSPKAGNADSFVGNDMFKRNRKKARLHSEGADKSRKRPVRASTPVAALRYRINNEWLLPNGPISVNVPTAANSAWTNKALMTQAVSSYLSSNSGSANRFAGSAIFMDDRPFADDRKNVYFNPEGAGKPLRSPISAETLDAARCYRADRLRRKLAEQDCGAILLYDPGNIRYAFDSANRMVWTLHDPARYGLMLTNGPGIVFEFRGCEHLNRGLPAVDEVRAATTWSSFLDGVHAAERVAKWADEIADILKSHGAGRRLAVDTLDPLGAEALKARGFHLVDGQAIAEKARCVKSPEELALMRWTVRACEAGMARMYEASHPGLTEWEIWSELHYENTKSGGEWLETKLLTAGKRTNPWFQECSDREVELGEMIAFNTDMVGPYGYCADISRSWTCGHVAMTPKQRELYATALEQINHNFSLLRPGLEFREFNERSWRIPVKHLPYRYNGALHGVGMVDEWPVVFNHPDFHHGYNGVFEEGMVLAVKSLIAEEGSESIQLQTQVLITATGAERMDSFPWESH